MCDAGVWAQITPEIVHLLTQREVIVELSEYGRTQAETWLTQREHAAAQSFLSEAVRQRLHGVALNSAEGYMKINDVLGKSGEIQSEHGHHGNHWDTCYAVWTLADWWIDRHDFGAAPRRSG